MCIFGILIVYSLHALGSTFFNTYHFTYVFLAVLGLRCCWGFSVDMVSRAALVAVRRLLTVVASLVAEHRLWGAWPSVVSAPGLYSPGSVAVVHGPGCPKAYGTLPDQVLNPCPLHLQVDSLPLSYQGSPRINFLQ